MKLRSVIIIVIILMALIALGWFAITYFSGQNEPSNEGQNYPSTTGESGAGQNQGTNTVETQPKKDLSLWYSDNDTTESISYDLKHISEDDRLNSYFDTLNSDVNNF